MNDNNQDKKAKIIPNSEINNEIKEDKSDFEDDFLDNPKLNFNYSYRGFKKNFRLVGNLIFINTYFNPNRYYIYNFSNIKVNNKFDFLNFIKFYK